MEDETYIGGSVDRPLLASYKDHVVRRLWNSVVSNNVDIFALCIMCYLLYSYYEMVFH